MLTSFISIQGNENTGWVVVKTLPSQEQESTSILFGKHYADKKAAEVAAQQMAILKELPYVFYNDGVKTVISNGMLELMVRREDRSRSKETKVGSSRLQDAIKEMRDMTERNLIMRDMTERNLISN